MSKAQHTEAEVIQTLAKLLENANAESDRAAAAATGACVYTAATRTYCASGFTQSQCDSLNGTWTEGGRCR
jgi:hypothetical protein